jgi:hypothetical protein
MVIHLTDEETPANVKKVSLYAWVGEDELGSGEVGYVPAGCIPLVSIHDFKISREQVIQQLQAQANVYGKTIRLCKFEFVEEVITIEPEKK